jgi:hypothetical protein
MKIAISIGHNPKAPGAATHGFTEYGEMAPVAGQLIHLLAASGHEAYMIGTGSLPEKVAEVNAIGADCAVELHANSGGGHGCETLYCPGSGSGRDLAEAVQLFLTTTCNSHDRGIKEGWYRLDRPGVEDYQGDLDGDEAPDYFLEKTNCPAIITEPYFLDTEWEAYAGNQLKAFQIAQSIRSGLLVWEKKSKRN